MKSSETIISDFFQGIARWSEIAEADPKQGYVIYGGQTSQARSSGHVLSWKGAGKLITKLEKDIE